MCVTGVYALFKKSFKKICNMHVQNEGGGSKAVRTMLKKTALLVKGGSPKRQMRAYCRVKTSVVLRDTMV